VNSYSQLFEIAKKSIKAGVKILQLRDKFGSAKAILQFSRKMVRLTKNRALYILNDRPDLALLSGAAGVHLGQDDVPITQARKILGKDLLIGVSCQTWEHAKKAERQGADYISFGSVFKTKTKPERRPKSLPLLEKVIRHIHIPIFAIGGISDKNIGVLHKIGVKRMAVCRSVCEAKDAGIAIKKLQKHIFNSCEEVRG